MTPRSPQSVTIGVGLRSTKASTAVIAAGQFSIGPIAVDAQSKRSISPPNSPASRRK